MKSTPSTRRIKLKRATQQWDHDNLDQHILPTSVISACFASDMMRKVILGGPTVGKTYLTNLASQIGITIFDTDTIVETYFPSWSTDRLYTRDPSSQYTLTAPGQAPTLMTVDTYRRVMDFSVGFRLGRALALMPSACAVTNLSSLEFRFGLVYAGDPICSSLKASEDHIPATFSEMCAMIDAFGFLHHESDMTALTFPVAFYRLNPLFIHDLRPNIPLHRIHTWIRSWESASDVPADEVVYLDDDQWLADYMNF